MDFVTSCSLGVLGVMVMLAGQVLGSAVFCVLKLSCQGRGGLYSVIWIPVLDPDSRYRPNSN